MLRKIYFAGSIRGGRNDQHLYSEMIGEIKKTDIVLTEHVGVSNINVIENTDGKDQKIYEQDTSWLKECDMVIAECTNPSLGVGYELAFAEKLGKPVYIFYDHSRSELSAMLKGNSYFHIFSYKTKEELYAQLHSVLLK